METQKQTQQSVVDKLTEIQQPTGRQDLVAPPATSEASDTTPVDVGRGQRVWLGFALVGLVFVAVILYFALGG